MSKDDETDQERFSDEESRRRFEAITRAMLNTPPEPRKAVVERGRESKRKRVIAVVPPRSGGQRRP